MGLIVQTNGNKVTRVWRDDPNKYTNQPDKLGNPEVGNLLERNPDGTIKTPYTFNVPYEYWVNENGTIREMTPSEKLAYDTERADQRHIAQREQAKNILDTDRDIAKLLRVILIEIVTELNRSRVLDGLQPITKAQVINRLKQRLDNTEGD